MKRFFGFSLVLMIFLPIGARADVNTYPAKALVGKTSPPASAVLAANKAASGGAAWNKIHSLRQTGTARLMGLKGTVKTLTDLKTGASLTHITLSLGSIVSGNDGTTIWTRTFGGEVLSQDSPGAHARAVTNAYLSAMGYWYPRRWQAKTHYLGTRSMNKRTYQVVRVAPKGGAPAQLWFDARTHLLAREVVEVPVGKAVTAFSDYRTVNGVKISFLSRTSVMSNHFRMRIRSAKVNVPTPRSAFVMPVQTLKDATFAHGATSVTIPFKPVAGSLIDIHAAINGRPAQLVLDTGGEEIVTPAFAKSLKLKELGSTKSRGYGKRAVETRRARVQTLTLGGQVTLHHQLFGIVPMGSVQKSIGTKISGMLGYEIFKHFVVRIDYAHRKLTLTKPSAFTPEDAGKAMPITFAAGTLPEIKGSMDGLKGEFTVDTGSAYTLIMWPLFVKRHALLSRYKTTPLVPLGGSIGGDLSARIARVGTLMFGPIPIRDPIVYFPTSLQGNLGLRGAAGSIGGAILKRFTVTFDYAHKRMYLKPNAAYGKPTSFGRSGMDFRHGQNGLVVTAVIPGTPASRASLKVGDVITRVDGKPATKIAVNEFARQLRTEPPGSRVRLRIGTGNNAHALTLTLPRPTPPRGPVTVPVANTHSHETGFHPGLWKVLLTASISGKTIKHVTSKECWQHAALTLTQQQKSKGCKYTGKGHHGDTYTGELVCHVMGRVIDSRISRTYAGDTATETETTSIGPMTVHVKGHAVRLGKCSGGT